MSMSPVPLRCLACDEKFAISTRLLALAEEQLVCPVCGSSRVHADMLHPPMRLVGVGQAEEYDEDPWDDDPEAEPYQDDDLHDGAPGVRETGT
jgi:hypothetical protein